MLRSVDAFGGVRTKVTSVCHWLARMPSSPSTGRMWGWPSTEGTVGCAVVSSPKRREAELARVVEVLVAEDERLVFQECGVDLGDDGGVEVGEKIHAEDLGADTAADPADVEAGAGGHVRVFPFGR